MQFRKIKTRLLLILIILAAPKSGIAQQTSILENFTVREVNGDVFLNWTIISGSTCNGIQIFRSPDGIGFTEIGEISGICGNISSPVPYSFLDINPVKNSTNFYRLELGGNGSSEIIAIEVIDISSGGNQIRPNPAATIATVYFDNDSKVNHQLVLYNLNGSLISSQYTYDDFFELDARLLSAGLYFFSILNNNNQEKTRGKILIEH